MPLGFEPDPDSPWDEAARLRTELDRLRAAAKLAHHEMRHTVAPRNSFTDALDALDKALYPPTVEQGEGKMTWQPIDTAPRNGTRILLTDGKLFAAGKLDFRIEPETTYLGYDEGMRYPDGGLMIGPRFMEKIPNPKAGERVEWWSPDGCSALVEGADYTDEECHPAWFEPTHWAPMLPIPHS